MGLDSFEINLSALKNLVKKIKKPLDKQHSVCYNIIVPKGNTKKLGQRPTLKKGIDTMKNSDKMTNAKALQFVLTNVEGLPSDVAEKLAKMLEQVEKKSINRKPTAAQEARAGLLIEVANFMTAQEAPVQAKDVVKPLDLSSSQLAASLLNELVKNGSLYKGKKNGNTVFSARPID